MTGLGGLLGRIGSDEILLRLGRNVAWLLSGGAVASLLGLATLAVTARSLGPAGLGMLALIETYVRAVDGLVRPETWQTTIRYGAKALEEGRGDAFARILKLGVAIDLGGATAAAIIAAFGALVFAPAVGVDPSGAGLAALCGAMLVFSLSGTPTAILRLRDRFGLLSRIGMGIAALRLALSLAAAVYGDLLGFVLALMAAHAAEAIALWIAAWRELTRMGRTSFWRVPLDGVIAENPGLVALLVNANVVVQARQSTQRFDVLIVGVLTDAASVGLYQLAKRIGLATVRLGRPLNQAIYPDLARLWASGQAARFRRIVLRTVSATTALALAAVGAVSIHMETLVTLVFGVRFAPAVPLMIAQAFAVVALLAGMALNPALYSLGLDRALARLTILGAVGFFVALAALTPPLGAMGASLAHLGFNAALSIGALALLVRATRSEVRRIAEPARAPGTEAGFDPAS